MHHRPGAALRVALLLLLPGTAFGADAFRLTALELRDPHVFASAFICGDITDVNLFGGESFNGHLQTALSTDSNGDGALDLGIVVVFDSLNTTPGATGSLRFGSARCPPPVPATACSPDPNVALTALAWTNSTAGTCLAPLAGTTGAYSPSVTIASHPCFVTEPMAITIDLAGIVLPLTEARIAARYFGSPTTLQTGLIRGFLSAADAALILVPPDWPTVGGLPLAALLPGGSGNCATHSDLDAGPGDTPGWWVYLNFIATPVAFDGPTGVTPRIPGVVLEPVFPNPFNPSVAIRFSLPERAPVRLRVHDARGRLIAVLANGRFSRGLHHLSWDGTGADGKRVPSGVYLLHLTTPDATLTRKMVLLK